MQDSLRSFRAQSHDGFQEDATANEDASALRWRAAVLQLSDSLVRASRDYPELAPIL